MQEEDENEEFGVPSKSARKREAAAAQDLGTRLIALKESELAALDLPETLFDAILLAKRITSRGGLARQRQYIGKLMRDIDPAPIEAALECRIAHRRARTPKSTSASKPGARACSPRARRRSMSSEVASRRGPQGPAGADHQGHRARASIPAAAKAASRELFRTFAGCLKLLRDARGTRR